MTEYSSKQFMGGSAIKMQEFLSSGFFVAPMTGVYYVTAQAGGGAGAIVDGNAHAGDTASGGASGEYVVRYPINLTEGQVVNINIGAGGAVYNPMPAGTRIGGANGGATSLVGILTLAGGGGGQVYSNNINAGPFIAGGGSNYYTGLTTNSASPGINALVRILGAINPLTGFAPNGSTSVSGVNGIFGKNAAANSGGGGNGRTLTAASFPIANLPGASGRLILEWTE